jgi:Ca-activated chloride channel family protein
VVPGPAAPRLADLAASRTGLDRQRLLVRPLRGDSRLPLWLLAGGWLLAVIALADPVWEKQPQPVFRTEAARVVVLDLSRSMDSSDLKPSRLERARYKVEDVLRRSEEGQVGLVVFAGDAFVVAPLTQDARTITELLKALEPGLMPVQGSRVDLGLRKAGELLKQAGAGRGEILLVTDGYEGDKAVDAARQLRRQGYTVSVLGVGTTQGAPLSNGAGGFVHDEKGAIVVPRLGVASLRALASAGGGRYATITGNGADLNALLTPLVPQLNAKVKQTGLETDAWRSRGPWLIVLLLPLAALAFRRGWLLGLILLVVATTTTLPQPAMASTWDDLWTRRDQQAAQALAAGEHAKAAELATDPEQRGTAQYRAGLYKEALADFSRASGPDAAYNQGNALARLGRYQEAIAAYDKALAAQPHMDDALHNKAAVEALLRQQKQQEKEKQQQGQQGQQQQGQQAQQKGQQSGQKSSESDKQGGGKGDSSNHPDQQTAQQQSGQGKDDSTAQSANGKQAQDDKTSGSSAAAAQDRQDKASANDTTASQAEARMDGQKGDKPQDNQDAAGAGQSVAKNKAENPEKIKAGNHAKQRPAAAEQGSPEATRQQAADRPADQEPAEDSGAAGAAAANTASTEEQQATEQWLRRIPDDPGGLLRRKFLYQYRQRAASSDSDGGQTW